MRWPSTNDPKFQSMMAGILNGIFDPPGKVKFPQRNRLRAEYMACFCSLLEARDVRWEDFDPKEQAALLEMVYWLHLDGVTNLTDFFPFSQMDKAQKREMANAYRHYVMSK